jgi:hypothetical protein
METPMTPSTHNKCPRCGSHAPHLHPAVQHEGEVQPCTDPFHLKYTPENARYLPPLLSDQELSRLEADLARHPLGFSITIETGELRALLNAARALHRQREHVLSLRIKVAEAAGAFDGLRAALPADHSHHQILKALHDSCERALSVTEER